MFAELVSLLHEPIKENRNFKWMKDAENAFTTTKKRLTSARIISVPDYDLNFTLTCDVSEKAAGTVLIHEKHRKLRIFGAASHKFSQTEQNWSATEHKAFSVRGSIKNFDNF